MRAAVAFLWVFALTGCAGAPPVEVARDATSCPDISGNYCAVGARWQRGTTEVERTKLAWYLGIDESTAVERIAIDGVLNGTLRMQAYARDRMIAAIDLDSDALLCDAERVLLKMAALPWGDGFALAFGSSGGWNVLSRTPDGALRVRQVRRHRGVALVAIPVAIKEETYARFDSVPADGICTTGP